MITRLTFLSLWLGLLACQELPTLKEDNRPNIVIIMADDMGYADLGCFGSEINTPNIDRLANNGLIMTQFYNAGRCCPTRASLLTGLYQHQVGIGHMVGNMGRPAYQGYLNNQCVTIAEVLKEAGYSTLMTGKWHVGSARTQWPHRRGFDRFYGVPRGGGMYYYPFIQRGRRDVVLDSTEVKPDSVSFYSTIAFNEYAVKFLEEQRNSPNPFFLYVAHIAPHFPLMAPDSAVAKYRGKYRAGFEQIRRQRYQKAQELGIIPEGLRMSQPDSLVWQWDRLTPAQQDTMDLKMAVYAAQVDIMDQGIGDIINKLEDLGELDNTAIIFLSDNGATREYIDQNPSPADTAAIGTRFSWTSYTASWANASNVPFRLYKSWVHEGGIATPFIIHYPQQIKQHRIDRQVGHIIDLMATCTDLAQTEYPQQYQNQKILPTEGISLVPIIQGDSVNRTQPLFWEHIGNRAIRDSDWKLAAPGPNQDWELYNIVTDRSETQNLAGQYPEKATELAQKWQNWADRVGVVAWEELTSH
ncbi:MAG: arylsulfatase [Bacteroidota bacterium]